MMMADFFMPAFVATNSQFQFLLQRLYLQPEILKKCQDEIDKVVGYGRLPTLNDRQKWVKIQMIPIKRVSQNNKPKNRFMSASRKVYMQRHNINVDSCYIFAYFSILHDLHGNMQYSCCVFAYSKIRVAALRIIFLDFLPKNRSFIRIIILTDSNMMSKWVRV